MKKRDLLKKNKAIEVLSSNVKRAGEWLSVKKNKVMIYVAYFALNIIFIPLSTSATGSTIDANASWNTVMDFIITWIPRLGAVLLFIGGVEFAIAYRSEDANGKTSASRMMVSGAMVIAIPLALKSLLRIE